MAAKATMREVDTLSGMVRKVFQCLTVDRYRSIGDVIGELRRAGANIDVSSAEKLLHDLVNRGFADEGGTSANPTFRRCRIKDEPAQVIAMAQNKPVPPPSKAIADSLQEIINAPARTLSEILLDAASRVTELEAENAKLRESRVSDAELAELRDKASKWDQLQSLMKR